MIERIKKLLADATPGPWYCEGRGSLRMDGSRDYWEVHGPHDGERWAKVCSTCPPAHRNPQNLQLIAAAINALPTLLAVVEAAETLINDMSIELDDERLPYLACQVYRADARRLLEALAKLGEVQP
jgi:hypothetical protein